MKRILALILALTLALGCMFSLTACGSKETGNTADDTSANTDSEDNTASDDSTASGGKGMLRVGVKSDVAGFGYQDPLTNEFSGMEIDLANLIADALGYDGVEFTAVTAATRTELLDAGTLDCVLATFTITPARKESWDFSTAYYTDAVTVLVEKSSGINTLADLVGKNIGVSTSSTSAKAVAVAMAEAGLIDSFDTDADFVAATFSGNVKFTEFPDYPSVSNALAAGTVDAFSVDKSILANYMTDDRQYIEESFNPQEYGVCTKKGSDLSAPIDELIKGWLEDGTIDGLIAKYNLG
jgi:aspartate/glutamate/glutamine transport system substrate-binding protein